MAKQELNQSLCSSAVTTGGYCFMPMEPESYRTELALKLKPKQNIMHLELVPMLMVCNQQDPEQLQ